MKKIKEEKKDEIKKNTSNKKTTKEVYYQIKNNKTINKQIDTMFNNDNPKYKITIEKGFINIFENSNILDNGNFRLLKYSNMDGRDKIIDLVTSISYYFKNQPNSLIYKVPNQDEFSMLYVYLMPFLSKDNEFIIKLGYSSNLDKRNLHKEFGVDKLYLLYAHQIKCETKEKIIHGELKKCSNTKFYPIIKIDKKTISSETYIFNLSTLEDIIYKVYKMSIDYEYEIKKIDLETKKINADLETKKINADLETKKINADLETKKIDLETKKIDLETKKIDLESKKIDLKITNEKLELEKIINENLKIKIRIENFDNE